MRIDELTVLNLLEFLYFWLYNWVCSIRIDWLGFHLSLDLWLPFLVKVLFRTKAGFSFYDLSCENVRNFLWELMKGRVLSWWSCEFIGKLLSSHIVWLSFCLTLIFIFGIVWHHRDLLGHFLLVEYVVAGWSFRPFILCDVKCTGSLCRDLEVA